MSHLCFDARLAAKHRHGPGRPPSVECHCPRRVFSHSTDRSGILRHQRIGGQQRDALDHRLRNEDAVKRVLVYWRQTVEGDGVLTGNRQLGIAIIQETTAQKPGVYPKIAPAETMLDRDLPQAGRTEDRLVLRIIE